MKKSFFLFAALFVSLSGHSQTLLKQPAPVTGNPDPFDAAHGLSQSQLLQVAQTHRGEQTVRPIRPQSPIRKSETVVDTVSYFTAAQSYYTSNTFQADGGEVTTFNVGVAVNGNKVTFKNFFNLDPSSNEAYTMTGTYDATTKTITIPASTTFENATVVASMMGYYTGTLIVGQVDANGQITTDDNLVLHVDGNFDRIYTTDQAVGVIMWTPDGATNYGVSNTAMFKDISINLPKDGSDLLVFQKSLDFGTTYTALPTSRTMTVINMGNEACDYAMDITSDPDGAFTVDATSGTIEGQGTKDITFTFSTPVAGEAEGLATVENEASEEPFNIQLSGTILPPPDFSPIVTRGDFNFGTDLKYPFTLSKIDGKQVVCSSPLHWNGTSSKMDVTFNVPEGKMGVISWKGICECSGWSYAGGFFVDDLGSPYKSYSGTHTDASERLELAPGTHTIRFQYDCYGTVQQQSVVDASRYYIWDLALDTYDLEPNAAVLKDSIANLGFSIIENGGKATATDNIVLTNKGKNDLGIVSVSSDNTEVTISKDVEPVATMKDLVIPVTLSTRTPGDKTANLTIETTAGTFHAKAKALAIVEQDFSKVVSEGYEYMTVENDATFPYIVDGDSAYNANASYDDDLGGTSMVKFHFNIPEGKLGILSWDGYTYDQDDFGLDHGVIEIQHPMRGFMWSKWENGTADSETCSQAYRSSDGQDDPTFLNCTPGDHDLVFEYYRNADGEKVGKSMLSFKNLKLHVVDFEEHSAELTENTVNFADCYVGANRWSQATVTLKNLGSSELVVDSIVGAGPFSGNNATGSAQFGGSLSIPLFFYPTEQGEFSDNITICTNAGKFVVACTGKTIDDTGIIYNGDLEDQCYGWNIYDADGDYNSWTTAYMLFGGGMTEEGYSRYCHSGSNLLGSASMSTSGDALSPDNWAVSPAITIPEEGGVLSYYVASLDPKHCAENYTVYVSETPDYSRIDAEGDILFDGLYELPKEYDLVPWNHYEFNLDQYKGKTIYITFRHHECSGQYLLLIDDIFVYQHGYEPSTGIDGITAKDGSNEVKHIYSLDGQQHDKLQRGVNVVRMGDGSTRKVIIK